MSSVRVRSPAPRKPIHSNENGHSCEWPSVCLERNGYQMGTGVRAPPCLCLEKHHIPARLAGDTHHVSGGAVPGNDSQHEEPVIYQHCYQQPVVQVVPLLSLI